MRRAFFLVAALLAVAPARAALAPLGGVKIGAVRYHPSQSARIPALERAIVRAAEVPPGTEVAYIYDTVALRDGRPPQVLVLLSGSYFCGTGGCEGLVLEGAPSYRPVARFTLMRPEWLILPSRHHGWRDIVVRVSGGGAKSHYATLAFNGKTYPDNPSMAPEVKAGTPLTGDVHLIADEKAPNEGYLTFTTPK